MTELKPTGSHRAEGARFLAGQPKKLVAVVGAAAGALLLVIAALVWYLVVRKPLTELPGLGFVLPPNYVFSVENVQRPMGVAVDDKNNRLYATQTDAPNVVAIFDLEGNPIGSLEPPADGLNHTPTYVAVDPTNSDVLVSDRGANEIYVYDVGGNYLQTIKPTGVKTWGTLAIAVDNAGVVFVADAGSTPQNIIAFKRDGTVVRKFGMDEGLNFPNGLAIRKDGSVVVADSGNGRVLVYNADGSFRAALPRGEMDSAFGMPRGVAVNDKGYLYIADTSNQVIRIFAGGGDRGVPSYGASFGDFGDLPGMFQYPNGIAVDTHGRIYIADRENDRIQVWKNK